MKDVDERMKDVDERLNRLEDNVRNLTSLIKFILERTDGDIRPIKSSTRTNTLELVDTATGRYFLPKDAHADAIAADIKAGRIFEQYVYDTAVKYIKEDTIVLDIGSNFGQMAIMMARHVGAKGMVHAFEANDFVFDILRRNVEENHARIKPHFCAVHNVGGETLYFPEPDFRRFGTYGSYGIDYVGHQGKPVTTLAIDDLEFDMPVSFIKIDVQGGDLFAMQGAVKTIEKYKMPILFEYEKEFEAEQGYTFQQYLDFIESINYHIAEKLGDHDFLIMPNKS
jgi:methyltransferase, FkbM family